MKISADAQKDLRCLSFNQQHGFFAAGTGTGFHIFSCEPFKEKCHTGKHGTRSRLHDDALTAHLHGTAEFGPKGGSGVGIVEMLFQTNILALVGGGRNPRWPPNEVTTFSLLALGL